MLARESHNQFAMIGGGRAWYNDQATALMLERERMNSTFYLIGASYGDRACFHAD
jgi:hypothetical protein